MNDEWDPLWGVIKPSDKFTPTWKWDVFGTKELNIIFNNNVSYFTRLKTKIFLGSKWIKMGQLTK